MCVHKNEACVHRYQRDVRSHHMPTPDRPERGGPGHPGLLRQRALRRQDQVPVRLSGKLQTHRLENYPLQEEFAVEKQR